MRHAYDNIPFTLGDESRDSYRAASISEKKYIMDTYHAERLRFTNFLLVVETPEPPNPIPLTVATIPAIFVPLGTKMPCMFASSPYPHPQVPDPCPDKPFKKLIHPQKRDMVDVVSVLNGFANVRRVNFFPNSIVVELVYGDSSVYGESSLPFRVAGFPTTYHHGRDSFFNSIRHYGRERVLNPPNSLGTTSPPQDDTNYLREPAWQGLSPGVKISTGVAANNGMFADATPCSTSGVLIKKGLSKFVTVANHRFSDTDEVFHPDHTGDEIGDIVDRYPELDIAMLKLTPANEARFTNSVYFEAEPPRRLVECKDLEWGAYFEVDAMNTGLISFLYIEHSFERPVRPPGHPPIPVNQWTQIKGFQSFGSLNPSLEARICGAPFVESRTGNVAGFFHLTNGDFAECAALDDLIAEGWQVV